MKYVLKVVIVFAILFSFCEVSAKKQTVTLNKCVDGDTAHLNLKDEKIKVRFLAIDTPEYTKEIEPYGKEASEYTCDKLTNAKKIQIEYDDNSDKLDKYDRHLVWVYVDGVLLQELLVKNGLAEVKYLYGDYKYNNTLKELEKSAKDNKLNIWSENTSLSKDDIIKFIIIGIVVILILIYKNINDKKKNK